MEDIESVGGSATFISGDEEALPAVAPVVEVFAKNAMIMTGRGSS